MKPLTKCPGCQGSLDNCTYYNSSWFQQVCSNRPKCKVWYSQNFRHSFEDKELAYIQFDIEHFGIYVYFDYGGYHNIAHIYSIMELNRYRWASPIMKLPAHKIDISNLKALDAKLQTLVLFV